MLLAGQHQTGERSHDRTRDEGGKDGSDHVFASSFEPAVRAATTRRTRLVPPPCTRLTPVSHIRARPGTKKAADPSGSTASATASVSRRHREVVT
ncbi:hypothetical protein GCM10009721_17230 [Terrabacter tumescens]|uniref:Uncharacterized protein n=1 Tax=Terrabacter tumescens TaxID=60443 RepID=A0ABQ2HUM1_9MICO|nr:hypothetical protein GCM10009721_17230 [Terrabacter tumescens]